jgi:hypothetical protein
MFPHHLTTDAMRAANERAITDARSRRTGADSYGLTGAQTSPVRRLRARAGALLIRVGVRLAGVPVVPTRVART